MSGSLPTLFRRAGAYRRRLSFTARDVIAHDEPDDEARQLRLPFHPTRDAARGRGRCADDGFPGPWIAWAWTGWAEFAQAKPVQFVVGWPFLREAARRANPPDRSPSMPMRPEDITEATFRRRWRGYDRGEVAAFLSRVARDYAAAVERVTGAAARTSEQTQRARREADAEATALRGRAEDAAAVIIRQATQAAEALTARHRPCTPRPRSTPTRPARAST
ncbi:MAG: DivIVA domain-containing protein, partial [Actinomycetota bacterium]|nr:DivIVA domain-containing protein [Actinomycetota bacterium]